MITVRWLKSRKYNERVLPIHPELRNLLQLYTATMKYDENVKEEKAKEVKKKSLIEKHQTAFGEAEVDLHIAEIIDILSMDEVLFLFLLQVSPYLPCQR